MKLLDGPNSDAELNPNLVYLNTLLTNNEEHNEQQHVIVFGHYQMPKTIEDLTLSISPSLHKKSNNRDLVAKENFDVLNINTGSDTRNNFIILPHNDRTLGIATDGDEVPIQPKTKNTTMSPREYLANVYTTSQNWLNAQESKILKLLLIILMGMIVAMFCKYTNSLIFFMRRTLKISCGLTQFSFTL